jgi:hypothetical protein
MFCIDKEVSLGDDLDETKDGNVTNTQNKSINTEKRKMERKKLIRERREKIEEFMLFDIDNNNSTANKENQRLL